MSHPAELSNNQTGHVLIGPLVRYAVCGQDKSWRDYLGMECVGKTRVEGTAEVCNVWIGQELEGLPRYAVCGQDKSWRDY